MDETKTIAPGYSVSVEEADYSELENAVNAHNDSAAPGECYWGISIEDGKYTVYEYGAVPQPPTADEQKEALRATRLDEASEACERAICGGIDVLFGDGTQEHFALQPTDQTNIDGIFSAVTLGATAYPYHADGQPCKMYAARDIVTLYVAAKSHVTKQTTYNNALRQWIRRESDADILRGISYGVDLPDDLAAEVENILTEAKEQVEKIVANLAPSQSR